GVDKLLVSSFARQPDSMTFAHYRREVADADYFFCCRKRDAAEGEDILKSVIDLDPLKAAWIGIGFPQLRIFCVTLVQVANQRLHAFVKWRFQQVPIEALRLIPFAPLAELAAHEQKLLARMRPHV